MEYKLVLFGHTVCGEEQLAYLGEKDETRVYSWQRVNWETKVG